MRKPAVIELSEAARLLERVIEENKELQGALEILRDAGLKFKEEL